MQLKFVDILKALDYRYKTPTSSKNRISKELIIDILCNFLREKYQEEVKDRKCLEPFKNCYYCNTLLMHFTV